MAEEGRGGYVWRYLAVGATSAAMEMGLFIVLGEALGVNVRLANIIALATATFYNFMMSRAYTFKGTGNPLRSAALYFMLFIFNQAFSTTAIVLLIGQGAPPALAKLATMACIVTWNFVLYRKLVFKQ
jgi:putative flippase GtrA